MMTNSLFRVFYALLVTISLGACGGGQNAGNDSNENEPDQPQITHIDIRATQTQLTTKDSMQLQAFAIFNDNSEQDITQDVEWSLSEARLATLAAGNLTAKNLIDTLDVNAAYNGFEDTLALNIEKKPGAVITEIIITDAAELASPSLDQEISVSVIYDDESVAETMPATISAINNASATAETSLNLSIEQSQISVTIPESYNASQTVTLVALPPITNIEPPIINTFTDSLTLQLEDFLATVHTEDQTSLAPIIKSFNNPVGITDDFKYTSSQPGTFISYANKANPERLVLILPSTNLSTYDKTTASAHYIPTDNTHIIYQLDDSEHTSLSITLDGYGSVGETATGLFEAVLCSDISIQSNTCGSAFTQIKLTGSFIATVENDLAFQSKNNSSEPTLLHPNNMDQLFQIADLPNHFVEPTTPGVTYKLATNNDNVMLEVFNTADLGEAITQSALKTAGTGQEATFQATTKATYLKLRYTGADNGTTFTLKNSTDAIAAQGSAEIPTLIGTGRIPALFNGTVDADTSYYELDVKPGHNYLINITNVTTGANISLVAADANTPGEYQECSTLLACEVNSSSGKIFFTIAGDPDIPASFDIEVEYAPERFPDITLPIVDRVAQVSYKIGSSTAGSNQGSNQDFKSGTSNYWIPPEQLTPNTNYLISVRGITAFTQLWINDPANNLENKCSAGGNPASQADQTVDANLNEIYCVVKTGQNTTSGFSINILGEHSRSGTPYILNVNSIEDSRVFYVSTFANGATGCIEGVSCAATIGMQLYRANETTPFSFSIANNLNYVKKALIMQPGETIYIRFFDAFNSGNFYSMNIQQSGFQNNASLFRTITDPDEFESGAGDNSAATAVPIVLNEEYHHSFSNNDGQFGDQDWMVFTAP